MPDSGNHTDGWRAPDGGSPDPRRTPPERSALLRSHSPGSFSGVRGANQPPVAHYGSQVSPNVGPPQTHYGSPPGFQAGPTRAAWGESLYQQPSVVRPTSARDVVKRLHRNRWLGMLICSAVWAATVAVVTLIPPRFESSTILLVDTAAMKATAARYTSVEDVVSAFGLPKVANQAAVLRTVPAIAEAAATKLTADLPADQLALLPTTEVAGLVEWLRESAILITAEAGKDDADLIHITAKAGGPELASAVSTSYAESYMSMMRAAVARSREQALALQRGRVAEVGDELTALDDQLRTFIQNNGSISIEEDANRAATRISDLQTALDDARIAFSTHSATLETLESELDGLDLASLAERVGSSVESEITATQEQLTTAELSLEQYYSKYPELRADPSGSPQVMKLVNDVKAMRSRLDGLSAQYVREVMATGGVDLGSDSDGRAYVLNLRQQIAQQRVAKRASEARVAAINSRLAAFERSRSQFSSQSVSLTQIQRGRDLANTRLKTEIDRLGQLQVDEPTEFIKRIQSALAPDEQAFPNVKLFVLAGLFLGLLLGGGAAFGWSAIDSSVYGEEDLAQFGVPVFGNLPDLTRVVKKLVGRTSTVDVGGRVVSSRLVVMHAPQAAESAIIRKYAIGLAARTPRGGTILFTSADMGAGKTTLTANVGAALSLAGYRTLVIDADIFRPGQSETLGLTPRSSLDVETGAFGQGGGVEQFGGILQLLFGLKLRARIPSDGEAQAAQAAVHLARFYGQHFDYVLVDAPPTAASSIAAGIGRYAHTRVLVVGAGKTHTDLVRMSLAELQSMGSAATEIAINRMDMSEPTAVRSAYQQAQAYYGGAQME